MLTQRVHFGILFLPGKPYEPGDLSKELDTRIKSAVAKFCGRCTSCVLGCLTRYPLHSSISLAPFHSILTGKEEYEFGDLTKEVSRRIQDRVEEFTGRPYEFGDISRAVEANRKQWVQDFLGSEAAENYRFGDISRKALSKWTGKDEYQFGDVTKKVLGDLFGPRKRGNDNK